ncbi:Protein CBG20869 [Caenorhabditis briggsae]|uniref:Protein CBG20869 n=1 Tax=Caenorhabditis briggsae TaxID=6238 RepID=A8XYU2_CAEBR|nr:Protein CBG20869 [Caenorhabditis briggsae]CAP37809.2 Protein CBG20869 [Caenorhabditis briggsae]
MKISIPVLLLTFRIILIEAYASNVVPDKLHDEFHKISASRLNHLKEDIPANLYLSMLFLVNNCSTTGPPATKTISQQMIFEETICGSAEMLNWCDENPERHVVLVTSNEKLKNKVFAQFQCVSGNSVTPKRQLPLHLIVDCAAVLLICQLPLETGKQSKSPASDPTKKTPMKTPNAKTPGLFSSKRTKKPSTGGGGELNSKKSRTKLTSGTTDKKASTALTSTKGKKKDPSNRRKVKVAPMKCFANGESVDGVQQYKVSNQIRKSTKPLDIDVYVVKEVEQNEDLRMKVARQDLKILKVTVEASLLRKLEKLPGEKCFVSMAEYGSIAKDKIEFLIVSPFGSTLYEVMKKVTNGPLSLDCAFSVGHQMLKAICDLHSLGYIHRNIRPSAFNVGLGSEETTVFLQDFRAVRKFEEQKKHVTARSSVKMFGTNRFSSRACQNQKDQGRKDDLESFLYTLFYLMDHDSLAWKKDSSNSITLKEAFMTSEGKDQFTRAPRSLETILSLVAGMEFSSVPDYEAFKNCLDRIQTGQNYNKKACDWSGKTGLEEIVGDTDRSVECRVTGERDAIVKSVHKSKKPNRKKLHPGDKILAVGATSAWKVINLLGSGGFGDVYKVHRDNQPETKCYALKTESEEGEKRYLRLKIEVTVMMKTAEKKKKGKFKNFIEFVDRGKCEALKCKFVVMGLVGPSLEDIRRKYILRTFTKSTAFYVAIETVTAIRDLHSLGYLHRDIKPANYAVGIGSDEATVYMLDFGIAKLYVNENGDHKVKRKKVKFLGTLRYACRACMTQMEQGRKDDLETWLYMVADLLDERRGMPWRKHAELKTILKLKDEFFKELYSDILKTCASDVGAKLNGKWDWIGQLKKKAFESESDSEKSDKKGSGDDDE